MTFSISALQFGAGEIAISPAPGRFGDFSADLQQILAWAPALVLTMTQAHELASIGAAGFANDLGDAGIGWRHLPVRDFGAPDEDVLARWPQVAAEVTAIMDAGGRVLVHCFGGCGRSGMAIARLLVEADETPSDAVARLRAVRPCAIETAGQLSWVEAAGRIE